jgi:hypothetical protein
VLAAALVLGVPLMATGATAAPMSPTARDVAGHPASHAAARAALDKVVAAFSTKRRASSAPRTTPLPRTDVTLLLRDLRESLPSLTPAERTVAQSYIAPPGANAVASCTGTAAKPVIETQHICLHYTAARFLAGPDVATPQQAQLTADTFEYVYGREVTQLHYRSPLDDGDGHLDVYLQQLGDQGIYGYCNVSGRSPDGGYTSPAACAVDNDFSQAEFGAAPLSSLRVTAAHEFFHAVQFAYNATQDSWFMEGTAVWMEDIVYPTINDYVQYLPLSQVVRPRQSTDYAGTLERYGAVTFWKFLSERFRDNTIIRQVWNAAVPATQRNGLGAVALVLGTRHTTLAGEFARYGVWNTLPPGTYGDRALWPSPGAWATTSMSRGSHDTGVRSVSINHLASAPLVVRTGSGLPARTRLRVSVDAPNVSHGSRVSVEIRFRNGKVTTYSLPLSSVGNGSALYRYNPRYVKSAIVVLSNGSGGFDSEPFKVRVRTVA